MTDYSELKRLATLAVNEPGQLDMAFVAAASPSVILAILAELEALRANLYGTPKNTTNDYGRLGL